MEFTGLPSDIFVDHLCHSYLPIEDLVAFAKTCKTIRDYVYACIHFRNGLHEQMSFKSAIVGFEQAFVINNWTWMDYFYRVGGDKTITSRTISYEIIQRFALLDDFNIPKYYRDHVTMQQISKRKIMNFYHNFHSSPNNITALACVYDVPEILQAYNETVQEFDGVDIKLFYGVCLTNASWKCLDYLEKLYGAFEDPYFVSVPQKIMNKDEFIEFLTMCQQRYPGKHIRYTEFLQMFHGITPGVSTENLNTIQKQHLRARGYLQKKEKPGLVLSAIFIGVACIPYFFPDLWLVSGVLLLLLSWYTR